MLNLFIKVKSAHSRQFFEHISILFYAFLVFISLMCSEWSDLLYEFTYWFFVVIDFSVQNRCPSPTILHVCLSYYVVRDTTLISTGWLILNPILGQFLGPVYPTLFAFCIGIELLSQSNHFPYRFMILLLAYGSFSVRTNEISFKSPSKHCLCLRSLLHFM